VSPTAVARNDNACGVAEVGSSILEWVCHEEGLALLRTRVVGKSAEPLVWLLTRTYEVCILVHMKYVYKRVLEVMAL
jgi:hypothetical protein